MKTKNILDETNSLLLSYKYETVWLKDKSSNTTLYEQECYGDPTSGLIDIKSKWALIADEYLTLWRLNKVTVIKDEKLKWIYDMRLKSNELVELLIDPWSDNAAIWEININTLKFKKVKDFLDYQNKEYQESVLW